MQCEICGKRPSSLKVTLRRGNDTVEAMVCGLCAHRLTRRRESAEAPNAGADSREHLYPQLFSGHHFPTQRYGMFSGFSNRTQDVLKRAERIARNLRRPEVDEWALLMGILSLGDSPAARLLDEFGAHYSDLLRRVHHPEREDSAEIDGDPDLSRTALAAIEMAEHQARGMLNIFVEPEHLLLGILQTPDCSTFAHFKKNDIDAEGLESRLEDVLTGEHFTTTVEELSPGDILMERGSNAKAVEESPSKASTLKKHGRNLTQLARDGKLMPVVGRQSEIGRMIRILCRLQKNNPLLLGEPGVGKTAVVEALAQSIAAGDVPRRILGCSLFEIDMTSLMAGTEMRGEFEERLDCLMKEVRALSKDVILFIDEIQNLVGAGASRDSADMGNLIKPALARGELHLIGATTFEDYHRYIEKDPALCRRFQPVMIGEPTVEESIQILNGIRKHFEEHHGVTISDEAISAAATLSNQYLTNRFLPDKAIDLIDEASSMVYMENQERNQSRAVIADDIATTLSFWTGIPLTKLIRSEKEKLLQMETALHRRVIDQESAVAAVAEAVRRARVGLKDPKRPTGVFLFAGPTGVGKTEVARALAEFLFDNEDALIRIDMSEYMEKESTSRLIGSPPGYVGYEEGGQLTEKVKHRPYSVILLDEMEKAHPRVLDLLLQVMDDGRLTDGSGQTVDFKNTVMIFTTNIGGELYGKADSAEEKDLHTTITEMVRKTTSPEFFNRIDRVVVFDPLGPTEIEDIAMNLIGTLSERIRAQGMKLDVSSDCISHLASIGYEPTLGARPLKRVIQEKLETPLSRMILDGQLTSQDTVRVTMSDGEISFAVSHGDEL